MAGGRGAGDRGGGPASLSPPPAQTMASRARDPLSTGRAGAAGAAGRASRGPFVAQEGRQEVDRMGVE